MGGICFSVRGVTNSRESFLCRRVEAWQLGLRRVATTLLLDGKYTKTNDRDKEKMLKRPNLCYVLKRPGQTRPDQRRLPSRGPNSKTCVLVLVFTQPVLKHTHVPRRFCFTSIDCLFMVNDHNMSKLHY